MRRRAKVDTNQGQVVTALRSVGCTVQSLATVGQGCPDLLVGRAGRNILLEVKDGARPPSQRRLTADEQSWHERWRGRVYVVETVEQALEVVRTELCPGVRAPVPLGAPPSASGGGDLGR